MCQKWVSHYENILQHTHTHNVYVYNLTRFSWSTFVAFIHDYEGNENGLQQTCVLITHYMLSFYNDRYCTGVAYNLFPSFIWRTQRGTKEKFLIKSFARILKELQTYILFTIQYLNISASGSVLCISIFSSELCDV